MNMQTGKEADTSNFTEVELAIYNKLQDRLKINLQSLYEFNKACGFSDQRFIDYMKEQGYNITIKAPWKT